MSLRIYVDEDSVHPVLLKMLRQAGHDVVDSTSVVVKGATDPKQLETSIAENRAILTQNYDDFQELHDLIQAAGGRHRGILVIRKDNDAARNLSFRGILTTIRNAEQAGAIDNQYVILNLWR